MEFGDAIHNRLVPYNGAWRIKNGNDNLVNACAAAINKLYRLTAGDPSAVTESMIANVYRDLTELQNAELEHDI